MKNITVEVHNALITQELKEQFNKTLNQAQNCNLALEKGDREGADFLGWVNLPNQLDDTLIEDIILTADRLRHNTDYVVCIGIGGSYLGTRAVVEALSDAFAAYKKNNGPVLLYAGNHISEDYLSELVELLKGKKFGLINISKSGTTTEPAIAFRLLKDLLVQEQGKEYAQTHIVAITDEHKGALRQLANKENYKTFVIPDNVGGRFSVLTPVGLLPIAVAGFDIRKLVQGARDLREQTLSTQDIASNPAALYATARTVLHRAGKSIEILANYHPKFHYIGEWWKQLYGESEGKDNKGLFIAAVDLTTDLHSMGQWMQEGTRNIFETVVSITSPNKQLTIPQDAENLDGLNYIAGKRIDEVNKMAEKGTILAHMDGGVPVIRIEMPALNEYYIGQLFYLFERAVGISGYLLEVNPFDQPGVEAYKNNMFALLRKPGYEQETSKIYDRLSQGDLNKEKSPTC